MKSWVKGRQEPIVLCSQLFYKSIFKVYQVITHQVSPDLRGGKQTPVVKGGVTSLCCKRAHRVGEVMAATSWASEFCSGHLSRGMVWCVCVVGRGGVSDF